MTMFGASEITGLDIGSSYIKAVQLKEKRSGYELRLFDMLPIPPDLIVEGTIIDSIRLTEALKELIKKARIKSGDAVISLSGHSSVIIKRITLPEMSEEELSESIKFEAEQYIPFSIDDVNLDFQILGPREEPGSMDVMLVAVKRDVINDYVSVIREAGINPVIVDVNTFALENMYGLNYETEPDSNIALINIGANSINMNIVRDGVSVFTRDSSSGSHIHTEDLQKEFHLDYEEAERLKRGAAIEKVSPEDARAVVRSASDRIISEVSRAIDFFKTSYTKTAIKEIILSGGCALVKDFPTQLSENTGLTVQLAEPFKNLHIPKKFDAVYIKELAPIAAVAVGLAMRRPDDR